MYRPDERVALEARLGFPLEQGLPRYGALVVQPYGEEKVVVTLNSLVMTVEQAQALQAMLAGMTLRYQDRPDPADFGLPDRLNRACQGLPEPARDDFSGQPKSG